MSIKVCPICGDEFRAVRRQKYCCEECSMVAKRKRDNAWLKHRKTTDKEYGDYRREYKRKYMREYRSKN